MSLYTSAFRYSHKPFGSEIKEVENIIKDQIAVIQPPYLKLAGGYPKDSTSDYGEFCEQLAILSKTDAVTYSHQAQTYYTLTNLKE